MHENDLRPEPEAVALIPEALARVLRCVPISATPRTLSVAVAIPLSGEQLAVLMEKTGRRLVHQIEPGAEVVDDLIEQAYGDAPGTGPV